MDNTTHVPDPEEFLYDNEFLGPPEDCGVDQEMAWADEFHAAVPSPGIVDQLHTMGIEIVCVLSGTRRWKRHRSLWCRTLQDWVWNPELLGAPFVCLPGEFQWDALEDGVCDGVCECVDAEPSSQSTAVSFHSSFMETLTGLDGLGENRPVVVEHRYTQFGTKLVVHALGGFQPRDEVVTLSELQGVFDAAIACVMHEAGVAAQPHTTHRACEYCPCFDGGAHTRV